MFRKSESVGSMQEKVYGCLRIWSLYPGHHDGVEALELHSEMLRANMWHWESKLGLVHAGHPL